MKRLVLIAAFMSLTLNGCEEPDKAPTEPDTVQTEPYKVRTTDPDIVYLYCKVPPWGSIQHYRIDKLSKILSRPTDNLKEQSGIVLGQDTHTFKCVKIWVSNRTPRDGHMPFVRSPDGIPIEFSAAMEPAEPWSSMGNTGEWQGG